MATTITPNSLAPEGPSSTAGTINDRHGAHRPHGVWAILALVVIAAASIAAVVVVFNDASPSSTTVEPAVSNPLLDPIETDFITRDAPVAPATTPTLLDPIEVDFITRGAPVVVDCEVVVPC